MAAYFPPECWPPARSGLWKAHLAVKRNQRNQVTQDALVCGTHAGLLSPPPHPTPHPPSTFPAIDVHANGHHRPSRILLCKSAWSRNTMSTGGICSRILQRSVELHRYHWMDGIYEFALCRVHVLWDQDSRLMPMMPPLICMLYVVTGLLSSAPVPSLLAFALSSL